jgi:hypothetical protein
MSGSASIYSLAGVAVAGVSMAAATLARRERTYLPRGHASRLDTCRDPLRRALRYGCAGLTVGVEVAADGRLRLATGAPVASAASAQVPAAPAGARSVGGEVAVGAVAPGATATGATATATRPTATATRPNADAAPGDPGRTLARLVLEPLLARVRARGRVHPAQHQPFSVVLEPAGGASAAHLLDLLEAELTGYSEMLTRSRAGTVRHSAVLVALAGAPRGALSRRESRLFFAEGTLADVDTGVATSVVPLVGEHVAWRFGWDGRGEIPAEERHVLRALVAAARAEGKRVRLFGVPEKRRAVRRAYWRELHAAGVDLIGARDVATLRRFLRAQRAHR